MYKCSSMMFLHAVTSVHVGSGSSVSTIDLPIQREKHTDFPMIAGSGLKGAVRSFVKGAGLADNTINVIFGPETNGSDYAGAISFTDAKILLFPVKSVKGVFAWITCPAVLERFKRELEINNIPNQLKISDVTGDKSLSPNDCECVINPNSIVLEEYEFVNTKDGNAGSIAQFLESKISTDTNSYWSKRLKNNIVIISNDNFKEFVKYSTEIQTRIKINNETGTVDKGALFYEENIPAETIFYSSLLTSEPHTESKDASTADAASIKATLTGKLDNTYVQVGGDATIGKGIIKVKMIDGRK